MNHLDLLRAEVMNMRVVRISGRITRIDGQSLGIAGLVSDARIGDWLKVTAQDGTHVYAEILRMTETDVIALPDGPCDGLTIGTAQN